MRLVLTVIIALVCLPLETIGSELATRNVVLITADGLRYQELFTGMDPTLAADQKSGVQDVQKLRAQFWRPTAAGRREALMPFFWKMLAPQGMVLGNKAKGSSVKVLNRHRVSYPGYAELLTGQVVEAITGNKAVRIPRETVLELVRKRLGLPQTGVAAFASWSVLQYATSHEENAVFTNAGYQPVPPSIANPAMAKLSLLQMQALTPWDTVRHDFVTAGLAVEYLKQYRPRLLYIGLGEADDWAHARRYDRVLQAIRIFDESLQELWETLQSLEEYRDKTTLILTADHGRGTRRSDWHSHGKDVKGSDDIWLAIIGPDAPDQGEASQAPTVYLKDVAAKLLEFFRIDPQDLAPH